jgi:hypothetical protein
MKRVRVVGTVTLRDDAGQALVSISSPSMKVHTPFYVPLDELDAKAGDTVRGEFSLVDPEEADRGVDEAGRV